MIETEDTVSVVRDLFAAFDHGDRAGFRSLLSDRASWLSHATGHAHHGPDDITAASWALRSAFPDLRRDFVQTFTSPERVVVEVVWSGTHRGDLVTAHHVVHPTGLRVRWHACYVVIIHDGKVTSVSEYYDRTGLFAQLGVRPASAPASSNTALLRRFYHEVLERGNMAALDQLVAPDVVEHLPSPLPGQPASGPAAVRFVVELLRSAIPDLRVTVEEMLADGDTVMARVTWEGTHSGTFMGVAPTGKHLKVAGSDTVHVSGGKIVEHWGQIDVLSVLAQLDLLPELHR